MVAVLIVVIEVVVVTVEAVVVLVIGIGGGSSGGYSCSSGVDMEVVIGVVMCSFIAVRVVS